MQDQDDPDPSISKRDGLDKGKLIGAKPPLAQSTSGRSGQSSRSRADPRFSNVQSGHRQQAAWLRCRCLKDRRTFTERVHNRSSDECDRRRPPGRQVRTDGADPAGNR